MPTTTMGRRLLILGGLIVVLAAMTALAPRRSSAQYIGQSYCASEVYQYCFSQGRHVDPNSCTCDPNSCVGVVASDCTEVGRYLSYSDCACHDNPSYISVCDNDPYALGCPRSFDTVFAGQLRTYGDDGDICSFGAYAWCNANGGWWSSSGCACSGLYDPNTQTAYDACGESGGQWVDFGNTAGGWVCYSPSGFGAASQCGSTSETLYSCVSSQGRWNPYNCTCSH